MLKPVIALTLTDFEMFPGRHQFASRFVYREVSDGYVYPENDIELIFVELPKFTKDIEELETITDKWIYFIKSARSLDKVPTNMDNIPELHRAFEIANQANLTLEELEDLERREMFIYDQQGAVALGREEGREEGRQEGKKEEQRAIAKKLLTLLDDEAIAGTTGLSLEVVRELREEESENLSELSTWT
jgi:predicted transposase/invertase (TIGR01784 family)